MYCSVVQTHWKTFAKCAISWKMYEQCIVRQWIVRGGWFFQTTNRPGPAFETPGFRLSSVPVFEGTTSAASTEWAHFLSKMCIELGNVIWNREFQRNGITHNCLTGTVETSIEGFSIRQKSKRVFVNTAQKSARYVTAETVSFFEVRLLSLTGQFPKCVEFLNVHCTFQFDYTKNETSRGAASEQNFGEQECACVQHSLVFSIHCVNFPVIAIRRPRRKLRFSSRVSSHNLRVLATIMSCQVQLRKIYSEFSLKRK